MKGFMTFVFFSFLGLFSLSSVQAETDIDYEDLFQNHQAIMLIIHPESGVIYQANQAAAQFYGYPLETLIGMNIADINALSEEETAAERERALEEARNFFIFEHRLADGSIRTVHVNSYPVTIDGESFLYSIIIDQTDLARTEARNRLLIIIVITGLALTAMTTSYLGLTAVKRKRMLEQTQNRLIEEERMKTTLIQNLPGVAYRCLDDSDYHMLYASDQIMTLTGYAPNDFYEDHIQYGKLILEEDAKQVQQAFLKAKQHNTKVNITYRISTKTGEIRTVHETARYVTQQDASENHVIEGFIQDMTDQRSAELAASYHKDLLQYIISHSNQGIAVHDKDLNYVYVSDTYYTMYQIKDKNIIGRHHYEVFPDLPQKWRDVHQRVLKGETLKGDRDAYKRTDGTVHYTRWQCQPWYDASGNIAGIIVYTEVINDLVETEIKLQRSVDNLELVMDSLPIGIAVNSVTPKVTFDYMNEHFPRIYGTTKETLEQADSFWDAVYEPGPAKEALKEQVLSDIASGDVRRMVWEDVPITKRGKVERYINAYATPIPKTNLLISTVIDVTERKLKEDEIKHASLHDYLTGLPNRRYYEQKLAALDDQTNYPLVVAIADMDGLKLINDAFGQETGDEALKKITTLLIKHKPNQAFLARVGGDEFALIAPNMTEAAFKTVKDHLVSEVNHHQIGDIKLSISIGHAIKADVEDSIHDILKQAEDHLYSNKVLQGQSARNETIMMLFETLTDKFEEEKIHSDRVSMYCQKMGEALQLSQDEKKELAFAGLMHDIGKITIPDSILDKPGKLTEDEWVIMKRHTINGYHILRSADKYSRLAEYALTHHERFDGKGYPNGLIGEDIPLFSRIISIADAYEAMTADRPYRKALDPKKAQAELKRCAGTQFDAKLVKVFVSQVLDVS